MRHEVWQRLQEAANTLDTDYRLVIRSGHRPLEIQEQMLDDAVQEYQRIHPAASDEQALAHARKYVTDPSQKLPPHVCAAAVDAAIVGADGTSLDFGTEMNDTSAASHLFTDGLTDEQLLNRELLLRAMLSAGFASFSAEWWHYSYGDQVWAWFYGETAALYDIVDL